MITGKAEIAVLAGQEECLWHCSQRGCRQRGEEGIELCVEKMYRVGPYPQ